MRTLDSQKVLYVGILFHSRITRLKKLFRRYSLFQIFVNKSFTTSLNDAVNHHSRLQLCFEAKELPHNKNENEMTAQDV